MKAIDGQLGGRQLQREIPGRKAVMVLEWPQAGAPLHPSHSSMLHMTQLTPPELMASDTSMKLFPNSSGRQPSAQTKVPCLPISNTDLTPSVTPSHPCRCPQVCYVHTHNSFSPTIVSLFPQSVCVPVTQGSGPEDKGRVAYPHFQEKLILVMGIDE